MQKHISSVSCKRPVTAEAHKMVKPEDTFVRQVLCPLHEWLTGVNLCDRKIIQ